MLYVLEHTFGDDPRVRIAACRAITWFYSHTTSEKEQTAVVWVWRRCRGREKSGKSRGREKEGGMGRGIESILSLKPRNESYR